MNVRRNGGRGCAREGQHLGTKNNVPLYSLADWHIVPGEQRLKPVWRLLKDRT